MPRRRIPHCDPEAFFDAADQVQVKYEMLRGVNVLGKTVTQVCQEAGYTRDIYYEAERRFNEEGVLGLVDRKTGPKGPSKVTTSLEDDIAAIKRANPDLECAGVQRELLLKHPGLEITVKTITRVLTRQGLYHPKPKKGAPESPRR